MKRPDFEALDRNGLPHVRPARVIAELASPEARNAALDSATHAVARRLEAVAQRCIGFGTPVHVAFGMTRQQAKNHASASLLLTIGSELSLDYCPEYN
jgi:hypothetical protein